jgi:hypothetical protein
MKQFKFIGWVIFGIFTQSSCFTKKDKYYDDLQAKLETIKKGMHYNEVLKIINFNDTSYNFKVYYNANDSSFEMDFGYPSGLSSSTVSVAYAKDSNVIYINKNGN